MNFNIAVREPTPPSFKGLSNAKTEFFFFFFAYGN